MFENKPISIQILFVFFPSSCKKKITTAAAAVTNRCVRNKTHMYGSGSIGDGMM